MYKLIQFKAIILFLLVYYMQYTMKYYYIYFLLLKHYQQIKAKTFSIAVKHLVCIKSLKLIYIHIASQIAIDIFYKKKKKDRKKTILCKIL